MTRDPDAAFARLMNGRSYGGPVEGGLARFDGSAAWGRLPAEQQLAIGATALEIVMAWAVQEALAGPIRHLPDGPVDRAYYRAVESGGDALLDLLRDMASDAAGIRAERDAVALPVLLGRICRRCGCSDLDACDEGCGWAAVDLCTACTEGEPARPEGGPC